MEVFRKALEFLTVSIEDAKIYIESQRDLLVYRNMLEEIGSSPAVVIIQSLESICRGKEFIPEALEKILASGIVLFVLDYPVMLTKLDLDTNHLLLQLLLEVYTKPRPKLEEMRAEKSKRLGRRKIHYPENWPELYEKWEAKEITGRDFMKAAGIRRGTFYHMVAEYKEYLRNQVED